MSIVVAATTSIPGDRPSNRRPGAPLRLIPSSYCMLARTPMAASINVAPRRRSEVICKIIRMQVIVQQYAFGSIGAARGIPIVAVLVSTKMSSRRHRLRWRGTGAAPTAAAATGATKG